MVSDYFLDMRERQHVCWKCCFEYMMWFHYMKNIKKNMIVMQKWRFAYLLVRLKKQILLSQTRPCDSNISILYSSSFGLKTPNVPSGNMNGELTVFLCLSRPDLPDYPVPPLPTHATCNHAKSRDHVSGKAHPSPPVEHEYHSIDVNYKRVTCTTSLLQGADPTMHPPADYKCVCLLFI